jgi:solute:Na+ symporter, SSS family
VLIISAMAFFQVQHSPVPLPTVAAQVTHMKDWMSSVPPLTTVMPKGYEQYNLFMLVVAFYLLKNLLNGLGQGADQKYFSARNERECGLLTFFWTWMMTFRWPMMMGFAVLGLYLVQDSFPDQKAMTDAQIGIKTYYATQAYPGQEFDLAKANRVAEAVPRAEWSRILQEAATPGKLKAETAAKLTAQLGPEWKPVLAELVEQDKKVSAVVPESKWEDLLARLIQKPDEQPVLRDQLKHLLDDDSWDKKLNLISYQGTVSSERMLPAVILMKLPRGLRGLFIISLVAAAMSTFAPMVNGATATFTRDIYQAFLRKKAKNFELMTAAYLFGIVVVAGGFGMAYRTTTINEIWEWLMMSLLTATFVPQIMRMYWWRFNGTGVVVGTAGGILIAVVDRVLSQRGFFDAIHKAHPWFTWAPMWEFGVLFTMCVLACVIGSYLAKPTDRRVLEHFYKTTRPFGLWKPMRGVLAPEQARTTRREHFYDVISLPFALLWQVTLFMIPMQIVIGTWRDCAITTALCAVGLIGIYLFWYRQLPPARDGVENGGNLELIRSFYEQPAGKTPKPVTAEVSG